MSATVTAVVKKVAVYIATNKKALKTVVGIVLGALFIVLLPVIAVLGIFSGGIEVDTGKLREEITNQQTVAEDTMTEFKDKMQIAGFTDEQIEKAEVLSMFALYPYVHEEGFSKKLLGCFAYLQTDDALLEAVNEAFGTQITAEEFRSILEEYREYNASCE